MDTKYSFNISLKQAYHSKINHHLQCLKYLQALFHCTVQTQRGEHSSGVCKANNLTLQVHVKRSPACVQPNLTQLANEKHCQLVHIPLVCLILPLSAFDRTQKCTYGTVYRPFVITNSILRQTTALYTVRALVEKDVSSILNLS